MSGVTAFPLAWPMGWPRTPAHSRKDGRARFSNTRRGSRSPVTFAEARDGLQDELERLGARGVVLSTNYELMLNGSPRKTAGVSDTGIAVYFTLKDRQMVMAQDAFDRAEDNMRSLTLALEAMRQLERHGGGQMMERAFAGFAALPAPGASRPWFEVLGVGPNASRPDIEAAFRLKAKTAHPDMGGSHDAMAALTAARDAGFRAAAS